MSSIQLTSSGATSAGASDTDLVLPSFSPSAQSGFFYWGNEKNSFEITSIKTNLGLSLSWNEDSILNDTLPHLL